MQKNKKAKFLTLLNSIVLFLFSVFVNRGISLNATSLWLNLQELLDALPIISGFLQPHRILLPILGKVIGVELQILNIAFLFLFLGGVYFFVTASYKFVARGRFELYISCFAD